MNSLKNQKGQSLVEFSIILPILLLIIMGIVQFAMILNAYLALQNASREGARIGIIGSTDTEVRSTVTSISPNLKAENITVNITPIDGSRKSGDTLTVNLTYNYKLTVPVISNIFSSYITLRAQTSMRIE